MCRPSQFGVCDLHDLASCHCLPVHWIKPRCAVTGSTEKASLVGPYVPAGVDVRGKAVSANRVNNGNVPLVARGLLTP
jgi:hypothetical protein